MVSGSLRGVRDCVLYGAAHVETWVVDLEHETTSGGAGLPTLSAGLRVVLRVCSAHGAGL